MSGYHQMLRHLHFSYPSSNVRTACLRRGFTPSFSVVLLVAVGILFVLLVLSLFRTTRTAVF